MENTLTIFGSFHTLTFKSAALNKATAEIGEIAELAKSADANHAIAENEVSRRLAAVLYSVERDKAYKADGFKSLAEYAGAIGLAKSKAHSLAQYGALQQSDAPDALKTLTYAKSDALNSLLKDKDMRSVVYADADKLVAMSQAEIREYAKAHRKPSDKPAPKFAALHCGKYIKDADTKEPLYQAMDEWAATFTGECVSIPKDGTGRTRKVFIKDNGKCDMYTFVEPEKPAKPMPVPKVVSDETAADMLGVTVEQYRTMKAQAIAVVSATTK